MSEAAEPALSREQRLKYALDHAAHVLPAQGPIGVFVHHNTLHAFEDLPFEEAVLAAGELYRAEPYMAEARYREELKRGRITAGDIDAIIGSEPDAAIFPQLSRHSLRRAMIAPGVREFDAATILWRMEQGDLARDFRKPALQGLFDACFARAVAHESESPTPSPVDEAIHPWLIRLCAVYLDQGAAYWPMPGRELGFYGCASQLLSVAGGVFPRYLIGLDAEFRRQLDANFSAQDAVLEYLDKQRCSEAEWEEALRTELLALPGWAGLMRQLESNPSLAPHVRVPASLMDFLAVRLTMTAVAARIHAAEPVLEESPLKSEEKRRLSRAARIYDAARVLSLSADEIARLSDDEWTAFADEVKACNGIERRRILHLAYERWHEREILRGLASHLTYRGASESQYRPAAQVFFCLDEREESIRRALEYVDPEMQTFGAAGYFGVAVNYTGIDDAHAAALCPVVVKPKHSVLERPVEEDANLLETRKLRRKVLGIVAHSSFVSSRTLVRGWVSTTVLGLLSAVPLIGNLLAPRQWAALRDWVNKAFLPEPRTELTFMRNTAESQGAVAGMLVGFAPSEKAERVASVLRPAGLTSGFARLVVIVGHGSSSLNNPHESAHDCGACGGRRGGPNARLFAKMANRPEVRELLAQAGFDIAPDVWFVGAYHDTCSDSIDYFDLEEAPESHRPDVERIRESLDKARILNAHERARRFDSFAGGSADAALRHVEERSEHLAEPRPEYGHCTNAVCIVGRRSLTRGLFLDRRAFLASYDATRDSTDQNLAALMAAVVPVSGGISLEYYFSFVDNDRYGCGTKLPHNVTGLIGVMDGHASDLRTGLPWQMVEIHEPVRMLFVVETTPERMTRVVNGNASIKRLVANRWIRLATVDPGTGVIHVQRDHGFERFDAEVQRLPVALTSEEWYRGKSAHLAMAWISGSEGGR